MTITIIVEDHKKEWYMKDTADSFELAKEILDTNEKGYNKMTEFTDEYPLGGGVVEKYEIENEKELDNACEIIEPKDTKVFVNNLIKDL